jgi:hypothetical protein
MVEKRRGRHAHSIRTDGDFIYGGINKKTEQRCF